MRHHGCDRSADRFGHMARRAMKAAMASGGWNPFGDGPPMPPGGPGFGFGGGGRGGGRGRRRMFDGTQLRLLLLKLIADEPRHGYSLIKAIEELSGGDYAPSPGVIYPTLNLMVDEGLVTQTDEEGGRRSFAITDAGKAELADKAEEIEEVLARLERHGEKHASGAPIRRSVKNLMAVVFHQLSHGADKAKMEAIVDLIDETARKIERL